MSVRDRIATPESKRRYVQGLFATIADRYDFITVLFSYGQDQRWKRRAVDLLSPRAGERALDLATGTGDLAYLVRDRGAAVIGLDITPRMLALAAAKRPSADRPDFVAGDMTRLPFASCVFDVVTTGYGLRNVPDLPQAIAEIARVLRPGGRLVSLDFNRPDHPMLRRAYLSYLSLVGGVVGWMLHRDPDTYRYIPASIERYPGAHAVAALLTQHGFRRVTYHPVLAGLMAIHAAEK